MSYVLCIVVFFMIGWLLGRKYQDFQDLMIARRVAKLVEQRDMLNKEREQFEKWERQDERLAKLRAVENDD